MPITLNCPKCHKPFRVRDESIGGRVRCPSCGAVLQVPAALSPASAFDEPPKGSSASEASRPIAEEVQGMSRPGVSVHEVVVSGAARREETVDVGPPPGAAPSGPPSIKGQVPAAPPLVPITPTRGGRSPMVPSRPLSDEELPWARVRGGLGMIRLALFLLVLLVFAVFGHAVWVMFDYERAWSDAPGLLKRDGWPLKKELFVAYTAGLTIPAALLLLVGRLRCGGAPAEAHARGLARSAAFFTFVAIVGAALYLAMTYFNVGPKLHVPDKMEDKVRLTAIYAAVPSAVVADVLTLLFMGQIGWPLRRPQLQKSVAGFFTYALLLPAAVLIGEQFYSVIAPVRASMDAVGSPFGGPDDDTAQRLVIWAVVLLTATILLLLRYAGVAGTARRAIRKLLAGEA